jgi:hypothetical protein
MERPTTGRPRRARSQAVTEESRPPLMATAIRAVAAGGAGEAGEAVALIG